MLLTWLAGTDDPAALPQKYHEGKKCIDIRLFHLSELVVVPQLLLFVNVGVTNLSYLVHVETLEHEKEQVVGRKPVHPLGIHNIRGD